VIHIGLFSVPHGEDDDFLAAWRAEGHPGATLYRALRDDVDFRFAELGGDGGEYEVVRADGAADVEAGCVLINPFEVPAGEDERFVAAWEAARAAVADARGYLGSRLHRSAEADFRFVNVARWSSPLMLQRATRRPEFQAAAAAIPFASHPALYQPVA
jgi:heme-degrading monooxygenase HmoA